MCRIEPIGGNAFGTSGTATSTPGDESQDVFAIGSTGLFSGPPAEPQVKVAPIPEFTPTARPMRTRGPVIPPKVAEWEPQGRVAPAGPVEPAPAPQGAGGDTGRSADCVSCACSSACCSADHEADGNADFGSAAGGATATAAQ